MSKTKTKTAKKTKRKTTKKSVKKTVTITKVKGNSPGMDCTNPQTHTRDDAIRSIAAVREKIAALYGQGKFSTQSLTPHLVNIDNAVYYTRCGEFDTAISICEKCDFEVRSL